MRIIHLETHVSDAIVAAAITDCLDGETPYLGDIGERYKHDPDSEPADRPRLVFIS